MALYKAAKNLVFQSLGKAVIVDEVIDLEPDYAGKVNKDLKLAFPDVEAVLVAIDTNESVEAVQPKKTTRKKKAEDTETVEDATE
ncbi:MULTISPECIES: hypothetical protein [Streptococcus]|uniref:Phage protein n=1 Tax=Streptococcus equi subsp. zooepidemicus Sz4is TaxID=1381082 RepID=A0AAW3GN39_STRSZ|nr:hypothetical protein [Streptococcus dysgalactiae]KIS17973.1 hypothetical protein AT55_00021 [Streptococcus equi subsp. zooepidemicus Sz4is]QBX22648.1 hypothetical protein Javan91_0039 [Streptococcus phage Javan91]QBX31977.1 hypothetical protein Javan88_0042 [Streptococcus phage Javan88]HER4816126.1 hypothetical protein [Streptococcus pyogenes NGAS025]